MNRIHSFVVAAALLCGGGCSLFQPQYVGLKRSEVASIVQEHGALNADNLDAWLDSVAKMIGLARDEIVDVAKTAKGYVVELSPPAEEAAETAVEKVTEGIAKNPGPQGIIAGVLAALFGVANVLTRRKKIGGK